MKVTNSVKINRSSNEEDMGTELVLMGKSKLDSSFKIPDDIRLNIFSYLKLSDLGRCFQVSREWSQFIGSSSLMKRAIYEEKAHSTKIWENRFGIDATRGEDKEKEFASLPSNIYEILKGRCPMSSSEERVGETHELMRIPKTMNGEPVTLKSFGHFIKPMFPHSNTGYEGQSFNNLGDTPVRKSYWVLVRNGQVSEEDMNTKLSPQYGYEALRMIEAVICISASLIKLEVDITDSVHVRVGTRCQEIIPYWSPRSYYGINKISSYGIGIASTISCSDLAIAPTKKI